MANYETSTRALWEHELEIYNWYRRWSARWHFRIIFVVGGRLRNQGFSELELSLKLAKDWNRHEHGRKGKTSVGKLEQIPEPTIIRKVIHGNMFSGEQWTWDFSAGWRGAEARTKMFSIWMSSEHYALSSSTTGIRKDKMCGCRILWHKRI